MIRRRPGEATGETKLQEAIVAEDDLDEVDRRVVARIRDLPETEIEPRPGWEDRAVVRSLCQRTR